MLSTLLPATPGNVALVRGDAATFLAERAAWQAAGSPQVGAYWASCEQAAAEASGPAIAVRCGDGYEVVEVGA